MEIKRGLDEIDRGKLVIKKKGVPRGFGRVKTREGGGATARPCSKLDAKNKKVKK